MPRSRPTEIPRATMAEQERHPPDGLEPIAESEHDRTYGMVGTSEAMLEVYEMVARVAPTTSTVLIQGETGTGKELIARAIHSTSRRGEHPFVTVDCSALAESLLESELFGHVKGAFTGAQTDKRGLIETAGGGTCFLDEIGEISACVQAKLLRVLQEREVRRVGGTDSVKVDVRVIAATNKDLATLVADGRFREDLFYRLSVVTIVLRPCGSGGRTFRCSPATSSGPSATRTIRHPARSHPRPWPRSSRTTGREMSGSSSTPSNGQLP